MGLMAIESDQPAPSPPDGELARRAQRGDRNAFDALIVRYQRQAMAVAFRYLGNTQDSLEVTQDAFLKGFTSISMLHNPDAFAGWLLRIVSNLSLNYRRSRKNKASLPLDDLLVEAEPKERSAANPNHQMEGHELGAALKAALEQLPQKQRMAITLFTIDELPQKQVAEAMDCSVEAVKWHVFQARKKLRELLKDNM